MTNKKSVKINTKAAGVALPQVKVTRQGLMFKAKDKGIRNFRVLNKEELKAVLADGVTPDEIQKVVSGAVSRWKAGWGKRKNLK